MKLLILSDTHFGYDEGGERWGDAFEAAEAALQEPCDAVLLVGDIFDSRIPTPETLARGLTLFERMRQRGVPVVGIHGTHERRAKEFVNPVQLLEKAGLVSYLHCSSHLLEKGSEQVAVHGMGGVPDQYAAQVLAAWNPHPVPGTVNILLLHQSLEGFLFAPHLLPMSALPRDFDLTINGHIHEAREATANGRPLLITGSAIQTQFTPASTQPRGYWTVTTGSGLSWSFQPFPSQRPFFSVSGSAEEMAAELDRLLGQPHAKKPVIRVELLRGFELAPWKGKAIFLLKHPQDSPAGGTGLAAHRLSVRERGRTLLREKLAAAGLDPQLYEDVFELLEQGRTEDAEKRLLGRI